MVREMRRCPSAASLCAIEREDRLCGTVGLVAPEGAAHGGQSQRNPDCGRNGGHRHTQSQRVSHISYSHVLLLSSHHSKQISKKPRLNQRAVLTLQMPCPPRFPKFPPSHVLSVCLFYHKVDVSPPPPPPPPLPPAGCQHSRPNAGQSLPSRVACGICARTLRPCPPLSLLILPLLLPLPIPVCDKNVY